MTSPDSTARSARRRWRRLLERESDRPQRVPHALRSQAARSSRRGSVAGMGEFHSVDPQKSRELLVCILLIRFPALSSARLRNRTNSLNGRIGPSANSQYAQCVRVGGRPRSASKM